MYPRRNPMTNIVGIDLGTTYSAVATIDDIGRPQIIKNEGKNITASCVMIENDELIVGEKPEIRYGQKGYEVGARFKRLMGETAEIKLGARAFTPTDLSAAVLKKMRDIAEANGGPISEAVITIPANFMQEARDATMVAAKKAGINVKYIINEPTAAALYYCFKEGNSFSGKYIVYDLGGGTFDVSVVEANGTNIEVLATEGVSKLGGDDFDRALRNIILDKYNLISDAEVSESDIALSDMAKLKIKLSEREKVPYLVNSDELIEVTRDEFEAKIKSLVNQAEYLCEAVLDEAKVQVSEIKGVLLAGGSTRVPAVRRSIAKVFKQEPIGSESVDEVVALGAALYAAMKSESSNLNATQAASISKLKVSEIATYFFGTLSVNYNSAKNIEELSNTIIISKGEKIPCSRTSEFLTMHENQTAIDCRVTKSGSPETDPRFVSTVWEGVLELPGGRPEGQKIEVTYAFDNNGMMKCSFLDVESGRITEISLDDISKGQSTSAIDKFLVE